MIYRACGKWEEMQSNHIAVWNIRPYTQFWQLGSHVCTFFATWVYSLRVFRVFQIQLLNATHKFNSSIFSFIAEHNIYSCGSNFSTALTYVTNGVRLGRCSEGSKRLLLFSFKRYLKIHQNFFLLECPKLKNRQYLCIFLMFTKFNWIRVIFMPLASKTFLSLIMFVHLKKCN